MTLYFHGISPRDLEFHLGNISYPASKDELINAARSNAAPAELVAMLHRFPEQEYGDPDDVLKAYLAADREKDAEGEASSQLRVPGFGFE